MADRKPITPGDVFGRWTVVSPAPRKRYFAHWHCRCACGNARDVMARNLSRGSTQSCGCWKREAAGRQARTHGMRHTPEYGVWIGLIARCTNPRNKGYKNYGARGISPSDEFRHDFPAWLLHVGPRPSPQHSIERIDNDKGYIRGNMKWALKLEQANNTTRNHRLTLNGETRNLSEWARILGCKHLLLLKRLNRGWSVEQTLTTPVR